MHYRNYLLVIWFHKACSGPDCVDTVHPMPHQILAPVLQSRHRIPLLPSENVIIGYELGALLTIMDNNTAPG